MIDIDSGFEEDLLSKNQNYITLETVHLENPAQASVIAVKVQTFSSIFHKPLVQEDPNLMKKKEIIPHLAF